MSNEQQMRREFPFLADAFYHDHGDEQLWPDRTAEIRVARFSLEAFELPMEELYDELVSLTRDLKFFNQDGRWLFSIHGEDEEENVGKLILSQLFSVEDGNPDVRAAMDKTHYILYLTERHSSKWRRKKGEKSRRISKVEHSEGILFKMPNDVTFRQLLIKYKTLRERLASW